MKILRSCLYTELGSPLFATKHKISQMVNLEYVEPITGIYKFGSKRIPWSYKLVVQCLKLWMETCVQKMKNKAYCQIDVCINLDHGKGHSRISANFICRFKDYDGKWCKDSHSCALGNARCKKDNAQIIEQTFGGLLDEDLSTIKECEGICITTTARSVKNVMLSTDPYPTADNTIIPIEIFFAGDILLYAIILGKEGGARWWCTY
mmetsp:Transcript_32788/g.48821  ORF Transcript_32788/g.48821 Transcript_32788/m.48821 type:complete len:206 (+) Transcript_32788:1180-1797(+)